MTKVFQCPEWPGCDCPAGTQRTGCPGETVEVPDTPAVPEPVACTGAAPERLWASPAHGQNWNRADAGKRAFDADVEYVRADIYASLADRLAECEKALDSEPCGSGFWRFWCEKATKLSLRNVDLERRAVAAEAALAEARKVIEGLVQCPAIADGESSNPAWGCPETAMAERAASQWLATNPEKGST